jgi:predicted amidophosphoribosyltransferase
MDLKTCRFCRKTFRGFSNLCPACVQQLDDKYVTVRNYLDRNENSNISRVAEETGVDEKSLLYLIREGRLTLRGAGASVTCLKCGAPILSGKYCEKCKGNLMHTLEVTRNAMESSLKPAPQPKRAVETEDRGKMHILKEE